MQLKKLEIQGFKSFPERIEIAFEKGITAIVGPNGSGKSNVADAMRWVMGEQSAKQLRGGKMEDVIFGGTDGRKSLSFCEVTLTLDNSDGGLPLAFHEVAVTRRMYRSGESEYYINKSACRLKDVVELFRDTGAGREGYSVIGQGRIDEILSNRPEDRRAVFEEAAGIAKYKARKTEAMRKLDHTAANLERVDDIITELSDQLEPLRKQAEEAKVYLTLRDRLRVLELSQFVYQYDRLQERLTTATAQLQDFLQELDGLDNERNKLQIRAQTDEVSLQQAEEYAVTMREKVLTLTRELEVLQGDARVLQQRLSHGGENAAKAQSGIDQAKQSLSAAEEQLKLAHHEAEEKRKQFEVGKGELQTIEGKLAGINERLSHEENAMEESKGRIMDARNKISDYKARRSHLEALVTATQSRVAEMQQLAKGAQERFDQSAQEAGQARAISSQLEEKQREVLDKLAVFAQQSQQNLGKVAEAEKLRQNAHADILALQSRLRLLEDMKRDFEGFQSSVRNLLRDVAAQSHLAGKVRGVVAQLINVPQDVELAVEMALGAAAQNIVTNTEEDAKSLIEHLRMRDYGRATFLPLSSVQGRKLTPQEKAFLNMPGVIGVAEDCVKFDAVYRDIVSNLLGRTVLTKDMESGIALSRKSGFVFRVVTLQGDILNVGGSITGGSTTSRSTGLFGREREMQESKRRMIVCRDDIKKQEEIIAKLKSEDEINQQKGEGVRQQLLKMQDEMARAAERAQILDETASGRQGRVQEYQNEIERLQESLQEIVQECREIDEISQKTLEDSRKQEMDVRTSQEEFVQMKKQRDTIAEEAMRLKMLLVEREVESMTLLREATRLEAERQRLVADAQGRLQEATIAQERLSQDTAELQVVSGKLAQMEADLQEAESALKQAENMREQAFGSYREGEGLREDNLRLTSEAAQRKAKAEAVLDRAKLETETLAARIFEEYEITYADALSQRLDDFAPQSAAQEIGRIRGQIRELGTVNVNAVEDFRRVEERHTFLTGQRQDLLGAAEDLQVLISSLEGKMAEKFREQFALINTHFEKTFKQLFGGGTAMLELTEETDVLGSGIEIIARPPGTRLQSLTLLSGGQRALTAIALLFAMLLVKPTPFCVLDEIESALDEANVSNYARTLHSYSDKTQFLVITHRKGTMEASDLLYGISMEEKGVSRMVSVRLSSDKGDVA